MFKKFNITDILLLVSALSSLIFSEILFFSGEKENAIFIGLWVPSILAFGIYLRSIKNSKKMSDFIPYFAGIITFIFGVAFYLALQEFKKLK